MDPLGVILSQEFRTVINNLDSCWGFYVPRAHQGRHLADLWLLEAQSNQMSQVPGPSPNVPPLRALWSLLDGIWGSLRGDLGPAGLCVGECKYVFLGQ